LQLKFGIASDGNHPEDLLQLLVDDLEASHEFLVALLLDLSQEASHLIPLVGCIFQGITQSNELAFLFARRCELLAIDGHCEVFTLVLYSSMMSMLGFFFFVVPSKLVMTYV
jgi:hypothetical protein